MWLNEKLSEALSKSLESANSSFQQLIEKNEEKNQIFENAQESNNLALSIHKCLSENRNIWSNNPN